MSINFQAPNIRILYTSVDGDKFEFESQSLEGDLKSLTTNKSIYDVTGSWTMELIARDNLDQVFKLFSSTSKRAGRVSAFQIFRPMGLIDIYINGKEVMLGIVDSITRKTVVGGDGTPDLGFLISGRDMGALFIDNKVWYEQNPEAVKERENFGLTKGMLKFADISRLSAHKLIEDVYKKWFKDILNQEVIDPMTKKIVGKFLFSDKETIDKKLTASSKRGFGLSKDNYIDFFNITFTPWNYEGDLFQFFKSFASSPFNELFVETGGTTLSLHKDTRDHKDKDGNLVGGNPAFLREKLNSRQAHLILRPTPYSDPNVDSLGSESLLDIHDLPKHIITNSDIVEKELTMSRNGTPSVYRVLPMNGIISTSSSGAFLKPTYDEFALRRYGHVPMFVTMESIDTSDGKGGDTFFKVSKKFQNILYQWFRNSDKYLEGQFVIRGKEEIRIGQKLIYEAEPDGIVDEPFEYGYYYITRVSHSYEYGNKFRTTVGVERGTSTKMLKELKPQSFAGGTA